ncbi:polyprenol monophosphomannose synthase [Leucobacter sp. GX24907]
MTGRTSDGAACKALVILPTYNEVASLSGIVERILVHAPDVDVLIVDDASPDGTGELADRLAETHTQVDVLHRTGKLGLGSAYVQGFREAIHRGYARAVEMDADGSHLPEQLPTLLAAADRTPGLVIGTRWISGGRIENWPWYRRAISRTGTWVARRALRSRLHDITSGFRVFDASWLRRIDLDLVDSHGYGFQVELAWALERAGCPVSETPITFVERTGGRSKMSFGIVLEALTNVIRWGVDLRLRPHRLPPLLR